MAQHDYLEISLLDAKAHEETDQGAQEAVEHGYDHRRQSELTTAQPANVEVRATIQFSLPHRPNARGKRHVAWIWRRAYDRLTRCAVTATARRGVLAIRS